MLQSRSLVALLVLGILVFPALGQNKKSTDKKDLDKKAATVIKKAAPETATLKWKFDKPFYQEMTTTTEQKLTVMQMPITQKQTQTFYFGLTPKSKDKSGNQIIEQKIEGVKLDLQIGQNPITFDSTNPGAVGANPLSEYFKNLVGSTFTLTINPKEEKNPVIEIKGKDEFLKKLVKGNATLEPMLKTILSDDALKQMTDPAFAVVPNGTVKKGQSWTRASKLNLGPIGSYETTYKYTYEGKDEKDKKLDRIKVDITTNYLPPADTGLASPLPFKIKKADLKTKEASGFILFDSAKGRVASMEMTLKMAGTLTIEVNNMTTDVGLEQTTKTKVTTSDENFVKKPAK